MSLGEYPLTPENFGRVAASFVTSIIEREDGTEKRLNITPIPIRLFEAEHVAITNTEKSTLLTFFNSKKGSLTTFIFIDPIDSISYTVRFADPVLEFTRRPDTLWNASIKLLEVL